MATLLALLLALGLIAAYVKLAARVLRQSVRWLHALMYAAIIGLLVIARDLTGLSFADLMPTLWAGLLGFAVGVAIGTGFFATRGTNADGSPLGPKGAFLLTGLALLISIVVGSALFLGIALVWR